ncbi:hypothetical protein [Aureliella helgolandensis]|uniref:Uncharacterized protein n=1 Tax=Aureliella helgolandensis TaxID=2527968 RepID=A0A518GAD7_9BACT|nr:hypothetical protein [Aureliella helgolandensis]QDV25555.1 hypothetical protein Q31a_38810 [Aureliella helgolandensis]
MFGRSITTLFALALTSTPLAYAQTANFSDGVTTASSRICQCGRWTCPACQQRTLCPPSGSQPLNCPPSMEIPGVPYQSPLPSVMVPPSPSDLNSPGEAPPTSPSPLSDPNVGAIPPLPTPSLNPNTANLFAANTARGASGAFGSSLRGATTPEMMGDFFGPGGVPSVFNRDSYTYSTPIPSAGYGMGRMKLAENTSPIPRDRVFFNYSLFTGVPLANDPIDVSRFSPGFEKTFLDGLASFELRTPFGTSLDNNVMANGVNSDNEFQFGNLFLSLKGILLQQENWVFTGGASLLLPTAADTHVIDPISGSEFLRFENESVHIMPFLGGAYTPNDRFFSQWMVQCDIDTNGTPIIDVENDSQKIGTLQDFTLLYTDLSVGYWVYKAAARSGKTITGIAPIAELHYNRAITSGDSVSNGDNQISQIISDFDNLNAQVGLIFNIRDRVRLGLGYATPFGNSTDRVFDKEFRITLNRYF